MIAEGIGLGLGVGGVLTGLGVIVDHSLREKPYESRLTQLTDWIKPERILYKNKELNEKELMQEFSQFYTSKDLRCKAILRRYATSAGAVLPKITKSRTFFESPEFLWDFVQNNVPPIGKEMFDLSGKYSATLRSLKDKSLLQVTFPSNHFALHYTLGVLGPRKD